MSKRNSRNLPALTVSSPSVEFDEANSGISQVSAHQPDLGLSKKSSSKIGTPVVKVWPVDNTGEITRHSNEQEGSCQVEIPSQELNIGESDVARISPDSGVSLGNSPGNSLLKLTRNLSAVSNSSQESQDCYFTQVHNESSAHSCLEPESPRIAPVSPSLSPRPRLRERLSERSIGSPRFLKCPLNSTHSDSFLLKSTRSSAGELPESDSDEGCELRRRKWVQLAGHHGSFEAGLEEQTILKKYCEAEVSALRKLAQDRLSEFVPHVYGATVKNGTNYIELQNLLDGFDSPSAMDCKIGCRTFLETELLYENTTLKPRPDLYAKMVEIDPMEPTESEKRDKSVSKHRYLTWRDSISSTGCLSFRLDGIKCPNSAIDTRFLRFCKTREKVETIFTKFTCRRIQTLRDYKQRLESLLEALHTSEFFSQHELIGSSLFFVHDNHNASVWMIDFGKTKPLQDGHRITHNSPWILGNHEDGYLTGLTNIINIISDIITKLANQDIECREEDQS